jgi:hypothetical protein
MEATSEEEGRSNWDKWEGDRYLRKKKKQNTPRFHSQKSDLFRLEPSDTNGR